VAPRIGGPEIIGFGILILMILGGFLVVVLRTLRHMPYVSYRLPTEPRWTYECEVHWEGNHIVVTNWSDLFGRGGEELLIDGVVQPKTRRSKPRISEDLYDEIIDADTGKSHEVNAHLGVILEEPNIGCIVSVDGVQVGGDSNKRFRS
jgi:hypothetical protein